MARIHIICGNCGNGDKSEMELDHYYEQVDDSDELQLEAAIKCKNCATIHTLSDQIRPTHNGGESDG